MKPKIVFLVMSAVSKAETVDQLARALAPHTVLVHHDFSQVPEFQLSAPNVLFVPNPKRTGWAFFGFTDGIFHAMQYAIENLEFDYLQLLSPTCLPVKPLQAFEAHVSGGANAHFDCVDLLGDRDALMSVGYRALTPEKSFRHRLVRRLPDLYFGASLKRRDEAGIWLRSGGKKNVLSWLAWLALKALTRPLIGRHIFDEKFRPYYGSVWFGASRSIVAGMLDSFSRPGVRQYFSRLCIAEEFLIPTLLTELRPRKGPMNHFIQKFEEAHPGRIDEEDIERLKATPAYFARKFPDNPAASIRLRVLDELVGIKTGPELYERAIASRQGMKTPASSASQGAAAPGAGTPHTEAGFLTGVFGQGEVDWREDARSIRQAILNK